ncbi:MULTISPECIES: hypothetical protein [Novosphingobium]|uniref:hypothetical protein n=1 Tax=Novosphingobium TaxID=165696 RepID=UPI000D3505DA|nr:MULTISPECIES: hypothetical protein [Novosphingobium]PTR07907.1 hypothetical protein C8K11_113118 [Novosphingobium sp. GV055]PUB00720.1 hypothetical protein C8K12_113118 [Novosphingobium sp. GV061]PUB16129.1 hypothetical protein C8K14_113118 [Novosphingobium sp. GV079]PUB39594.1 hypothetical protein C8K10_113118 [Novosphingobium sp. GV027]WQD93737.1 hypothetical protein U0041_03840 [Novosphingobium capsulatum]
MINLFSLTNRPSEDGLPIADFHITESGDGSIGVMYGSMWIMIPRKAHDALLDILRDRLPESEPKAERPPEYDWHCGNGYLRDQWLFTLLERNPKLATSLEAQGELEETARKAGPEFCQMAIANWRSRMPLNDDDIPF